MNDVGSSCTHSGGDDTYKGKQQDHENDVIQYGMITRGSAYDEI